MISNAAFDLENYLKNFILKEDLFSEQSGTRTEMLPATVDGIRISRFVNEFWTARQRQASSIHEVSYRACFKPQLPRFFIKLLTNEGDVVYDPFAGRGTTALEAGLMNRRIVSNDINPLSEILTRPRFFAPNLLDIEKRLKEIPFSSRNKADLDLSMFYHPDTESEIVSIRQYLMDKKAAGDEDDLDAWIRMVATNRLTGHSRGFFSVYTLPPNQAASPENQRKINEKRSQKPEYRNTREIVFKKSVQLLRDLSTELKHRLRQVGESARFLNRDARVTREIEPDSVNLTVTSPPFLNVVQYSKDNWLRCWFNGIDAEKVSGGITLVGSLKVWTAVMGDVFHELYRITAPGGWVAFEVGEVKKGRVQLEEYIAPLGVESGFSCEGVLINSQHFTKTSNIWGVSNNSRGTNTNRIVMLHKR